ncbi:MAG: UDP-N-acetylmuramoyl-L-alanine--D-glutamate ligase [Chloroflexi bacterium]|nr:UDP-N-acetylmuramoyl-L-alanine--D-glutamate ligase [Chloroflexota bacterium]
MRSSEAEAVLNGLRGQRALVIGLAREGVDLTRFLTGHGARVTVTDTRSSDDLAESVARLDGAEVSYHLGGHQLTDVEQADVVYASPGVPPENPLLVRARQRGIRQSSLVELFFQLCPAPILGITGSAGKSTTTSLLGEMFVAAGRQVFVGGNIGRPLLGKLEAMTERSWVVMELSSFQLEPLQISPHIALITNVTPNHLDRHPTMEAYWAAKGQILAHQSAHDWAVLNADDEWSRRYAPPGNVLQFSLERVVDGAYLGDHERCVMLQSEPVIETSEIPLRGRHNVANVLAAVAAARAAGIPKAAMQAAIRGFNGVAHRLQTVAERNGVTWVDDSIATAPERSIAALRAYHEPLVLIAGGRDKHLPMEEWAALIVERVRHVVLLGEMSDLVAEAITRVKPTYHTMTRAHSMDEAVRQAERVATAGDVVLLSPGGTSYDMYHDFEERGRAFQSAVEALES